MPETAQAARASVQVRAKVRIKELFPPKTNEPDEIARQTELVNRIWEAIQPEIEKRYSGAIDEHMAKRQSELMDQIQVQVGK